MLQGFSDDEVALLGCAVALLSSGLLMWVSYYVGQFVRRGESSETTVAIETLRAERRDAEVAKRKDIAA